MRLSGMGEAQDVTDDNGQYSFSGLRAGTYSVEISGFDMNEVSFSSTSGAASVGVGESKVVSFDGTYLRTAGVQGQVTIVDSGAGLGGVTVTLLGQGEDRTEMTNASGNYAFSQLKGGTYQVAISGYDTDDYEFQTTSKSVTVATGETANVPFEGTLLRTAGIAGRVSLDDGMGLDGVMVTLAGAAESSTETSNGGQYSFAGLAAGSYIVSISNPDANAYNFDDDELQKTVELMDDQSAIVNFSGTHARTASVSGMLFIDEVVQDKMHNAGEPSITEAITPLVAAGALDAEVVAGLLAKAKVKLRGPDLNTMQDIDINADGSFSTGESLVAGTYQVELPVNDDDVAAGLAAAGVAFVGESMVVEVAAGGSAIANFPFRITMQTVATGARMGGGGHFGVPVAGVKLALYARADGTGMLGEAMTDEMGAASFTFARADNIGPAGNDNIIFVRAVETGHDDLVVSGNEYVEIAYAPTSRLYMANDTMEVATLVNVHANFQFWVKSDKDARSGDMPLAGWKTAVFMGEVTDDSKPLMKPDPEDDTKMVNLTDPTEDEDGELGRGTVSYMVDPAMLPAAFTVVVPPGQSSEMYDASGVLTHVHTGLEHPDMNSMEMNDLGPVYLKWSTQALSVGVYRETDDEPGWTNYQSKVDGGDQRPSAAVSQELEVELMVENNRGRLTRYEYKRFDSEGARTIDVPNPMSFGKSGTAKFPNLPADMEFTVRFHAGSDRKAVVDAESDRNGRDVDSYGGDLDDGTSIGAFGDMAGAGPEVRLCPMSPSSADDCATFAYQWATGEIGGTVTRRGAGVASAAVNLDAITDNHGTSENTKTSKARGSVGEYSISGVQDGEYWVGTPATADNKADSMRVAFYHDETMDDDADDGIIGNPVSHTWSPDVTALRLEIRGFVANDGQEGDNLNPDLDQIVRGDEAVAGIQLELLTITKISDNQKDTTFKVHDREETADDGSYVFDDVTEGSAYFVRATGSGIYVAAEASAKDGFSRQVAADEYPAVEEGEFGLPYWDYNAGTAKNTKVTVSNADGVSADFVNFALLYSDGTIAGRVEEASGSAGNITIELIRCETYDAEDGECSTYNRSDFPTMTTETGSKGTWEFNDLLEGWYEVYVGEAGYLAANIDDNNVIDDDASTVSDEMHTGLVKGKRDLAAGNNFYVYDNGLDDDDELGSDGVVIKGTTDPDEDPVELTSSSDVITWASKNVTVTPDIHRDASFAARTASRGAKAWPQSKGVATVEPDFNATGSANEGEVKATEITVTVTAENGYHDTDYTYMVYRAAPVGNDLAAGDFTVEAPAGARIRADQGVVDQFSMNVAEAATDLTFTVTLEDSDKQELAVTMGGSDVDPSDRKRADGAHEFRYELTLATGANTVDITVTSEDDVDREYQLVVRRGPAPGNNPATGRPAIDNTSPKVGQTLTASIGDVADADGINSATIRYDWFRGTGTSAISTGSQYTAASADLNETLSVEVSFADNAGFAESLRSAATAAVAAADVPASDDATLSGLSVSPGGLNETFAGATKDYTVDVAHDVATVTVEATKNHSGASNPVIMPADADMGTAGHQVALGAAGTDTKITVTVTAEDGSTTTTPPYAITVTRADEPPPSPGLVVSLDDEVTVREGTELEYTVRLATPPDADVTVAIAVAAPTDATDTDVAHVTVTRASLVFSQSNWNSARTVAIQVSEDADEDTEIAEVTHSVSGTGSYASIPPVVKTVNAEDNDVVAGAAIVVDQTSVSIDEGDSGTEGTATFMVRLAAEPSADVTVTATSGAAAVATVSAGSSLTFTPANWDDEQSVTVTAVEDTNPADAMTEVTLAASGGGYGSADDVEVAVMVVDNEMAEVTVSEAFTGAEAAEGTSFTYTVALSTPPATGTVYVNLAASGGVGSVNPSQVAFTEAATVTVMVTLWQDADENDGTLTIAHSVLAADGTGYESGAIDEVPSDIRVTVKDDDVAGVVVSRTSLESAADGTASYDLCLTKPPATGETVTINLTANGANITVPTGATVDMTSVICSAASGNTTPVTIGLHGGATSATVDHTVSSVNSASDGAKDYEGVTASSVTVTKPS